MVVLVLGSTGNTGYPLVRQLLDRGHKVRTIVRSPEKFKTDLTSNPNLTIIESNPLTLPEEKMKETITGCDAVVSCLGHVVSLKGMFGAPRELVTDVVKRTCHTIELVAPAKKVKFILMSSVAVANPDTSKPESRKIIDRLILFLVRALLPPHRDNESAAKYLRSVITKDNDYIEWCSVRPDGLLNLEVGEYTITESPITSFTSAGITTRSNVAHFMCELIEKPKFWNNWKGKMPAILDKNQTRPK